MPERRVCRRVHADHEAVQRSHSADLRRERRLAKRYGVHERMQRRGVLWVVQPECEAMQRPDDANVRFDRDVAGRRDVREPSLRERFVHRHVRPWREALLEQRRPDL